ncbi:hypothetical protein [Falsiroseomonas sp.]|uniref:cell division protein FtsL n=1 Tax=Falsiroseomonas sp. TaxID=2870721 RepID=UPI0035658B27
MIRPFTLLCFCAFAGAGAWLYQVKHSVAVKDRELVAIQRETEQARQRLDILRAEWALLNEPDRLRQTATRMLALQPMQPQQFMRPNQLGQHLPAAIAFAGAPDIFADPVTPEPQAAGVMLASTTAGATPAATSPTPPPAAAAAPAETPAPRALAAAVAAQRAEQVIRVAARPAPPPAPVTARAAPPPRPIQPAVHVAPAPTPAPPVTRIAPTPAPPTAIASAVGSTSLLGGASALGRPLLAPPVPVRPAAAATLR